MRYHIVSLVAVFLALGVGIVIGTTFVGDRTLPDFQQELVEQLYSDIRALDEQRSADRELLQRTEADLAELRRFADQVFPVIISNKLLGREVGIVLVGDDMEVKDLDTVSSVVEAAGGSIGYSMSILERLSAFPSIPGVPQTPETQSPTGKTTVAGRISEVATSLASALISQSGLSGLSGQDYAGLLKLHRAGEFTKIDSVVLVAGGRAASPLTPSEIAAPLATALIADGVSVVAVERSSAPISYLQSLTDSRMSSVDNIDTIPGKYSLVMCLAGARGRFGVKRASTSLIPAPPG